MINKDTVNYYQAFNAQDKANNPYNKSTVTIYDIRENKEKKELYNTPIERLKRFAEYLKERINTLQQLLNVVIDICGNELEQEPHCTIDESTIETMNTNIKYLFRFERRTAPIT